jgi:hypothetical protein
MVFCKILWRQRLEFFCHIDAFLGDPGTQILKISDSFGVLQKGNKTKARYTIKKPPYNGVMK